MIIDFLKEKKVVVFYIIFTVIWNLGVISCRRVATKRLYKQTGHPANILDKTNPMPVT